MIFCIQPKIRLLIWQLFLNIRIRSSDSCIGMNMLKNGSYYLWNISVNPKENFYPKNLIISFFFEVLILIKKQWRMNIHLIYMVIYQIWSIG